MTTCNSGGGVGNSSLLGMEVGGGGGIGDVAGVL